MTSLQSILVKLGTALAVVAGGVFVFMSEHSRRSEARATMQSPPAVSPFDLSIALIRVGLGAKNVTAAGISINAVDSVADNVRSQLANCAETLATADASSASLRNQVEVLERKIQSGQAQEQDVSNLATARSNLATAQASRQTTLDGLHNAGVANLSEGQKAILTSIRVNSSWELPMEYLTVSRSQAQWVALRSALANERIAAANEQQPDPEAQALLAQVRADNTVAAASANLVSNLAATTAAWNQSLNP